MAFKTTEKETPSLKILVFLSTVLIGDYSPDMGLIHF